MFTLQVFTLQELSNVDVAEGGSVKIWRVDGVKRVNLAKEKYSSLANTWLCVQ